MYSFGLILPLIKEQYDATEEDLSRIRSLNTGFLFCSGPIVAGLTATFGCRAVIITGGFVTAISYMMCIYSPSIKIIWLLYGFIGGK